MRHKESTQCMCSNRSKSGSSFSDSLQQAQEFLVGGLSNTITKVVRFLCLFIGHSYSFVPVLSLKKLNIKK